MKSGPTARVSSWEITPAASGVPHAAPVVGTGVWDREVAQGMDLPLSSEVTKPLVNIMVVWVVGNTLAVQLCVLGARSPR